MRGESKKVRDEDKNSRTRIIARKERGRVGKENEEETKKEMENQESRVENKSREALN